MSFDNDEVGRIDTLIEDTINAGYSQTAGPTLRAVTASTNSGLIAADLDALDNEVDRLLADGKVLTIDNPVLRNLMNDLQPTMADNADEIGIASPGIQADGVSSASTLTKQTTVMGLDANSALRINAAWNVPDPEAVNAVVGYVQNPAWNDELAKYGIDVFDTINNHAIASIVNGQGSRTTARQIRQLTENLPASQADNLMRTLHIQSYQTATAQNQLANIDILAGQIRIETLDGRICLACIDEHGREYPAGEKVIDHHKGRGTAISMVKGVDYNVATGEDWFYAQPVDSQREIAGNANWKALDAGAVTLKDFRQPYTDPVFGDMQRESSLVSILDDEAKQYYG